jgi:FkbM family methyltransferase
MNLEYMISYTNQQNDQYFEDFLELERANLNFYDLGCFDGYASSEFARLSPEYSSINAFEPIPRQHQECVKNLELLDSCVVHNFGAAERNHSLMFSDNGSASTAIDGIGTLVSLKRLDDLDLPLPDLIKIDIEGSEVDAMRGMRNLIQLGQPTMAVACYHYPSEMRDIVGFWDSLSLNGPLQLRHYTEGISETVIFITPEFSE